MTCWSFPETATRAALLVALAAAGGARAECGDGLTKPRVLQGARHQVAYTASPAVIPLNRQFVLDVVACPLGAAAPPETLVVDARMPEHGHGMTYQPQARAGAPGRWRVEGLLLHMRGRWVLSFDVGSGAQRERVTDTVLLK